MLVKNFTDVGLKGYFFGHGDVEIAAGEIKDLPEPVVREWMNPKNYIPRLRVPTKEDLVEDALKNEDVVDVEEEAESDEVDLTPAPKAVKRPRGKKED